MSEKFDKGLQYRTLNCLRSAISAYHVHIDGKSMGSIQKFVLYWQVYLIKDFHNLDVLERVLQYIRTNWYAILHLMMHT